MRSLFISSLSSRKWCWKNILPEAKGKNMGDQTLGDVGETFDRSSLTGQP